MVMAKCPKCGSENIDFGYPTAYNRRLIFISSKQKGLFANPENIKQLTAYVCLDCGYVEFSVDSTKS
ncbi:MAG: hypothetical protein QW400_01715 [Candidatus Diapherotrites archaeon]